MSCKSRSIMPIVHLLEVEVEAVDIAVHAITVLLGALIAIFRIPRKPGSSHE
jgi:hypothetical protein